MSKKSSDNINDNTKAEDIKEEESVAESTEETADEKPVLPRKRKITRNVQLIVPVVITAAAVIIALSWKLFFNNSLFGKWHLDVENEPAETSDAAETSDEADNVTTINYEFKENGECIVSLGTMTVEGTYQLASTEDSGSVISASVFSGNSPIFYGTYKYKVRGNAFTGRSVELLDMYDTDAESMTLEEGNVEAELAPFESFATDKRLVGSWYDEENRIMYEFTDDGYMTRTISGGMVIKHAYTVMEDNCLILKYIDQAEETVSYIFEFKGNDLYIEGVKLTRASPLNTMSDDSD